MRQILDVSIVALVFFGPALWLGYFLPSPNDQQKKGRWRENHRLVGGLGAIFYFLIYWEWSSQVWNINFIFSYIGNLIIPIDELIFFRGVAQPPTSTKSLFRQINGNHWMKTQWSACDSCVVFWRLERWILLDLNWLNMSTHFTGTGFHCFPIRFFSLCWSGIM